MINDATLSSLTQMGEDLYEAECDVLNAEEDLKRAKAVRDAIATQTVPEFLEENGLEAITMSDGREVRVKDFLSVTPKKENRPLVLAELVKQGAGALIKTNMTVAFGRDSAAEVKRINELLQAEGLSCKVETKVESSTLKKHVRLRLEAGKHVDQKLFGVREFRKAEFTKGAPKPQPFGKE